MKTKLIIALVLIGAPLIFLKPVKAQNSQPVSEFTKLNLSATANVELVIADRYSVYIQKNAEQLIASLKVVNNELTIGDNFGTAGKIKVFAKSITDIKMDGGAKLECLDSLKSADLSIKMDGASKAHLIISNNNTNVNMDGGANLILVGVANNAVIKTDGAVILNANGLTVNNMNIEADGSSNAKILVTESLYAKADGASIVTYIGEPKNKMFSIDGVGKIKSNTDEYTADFDVTIPQIKNSPDADTTRLKIGKRKFIIIDDEKKDDEKPNDEIEKRRRMKHVYAGFETGVNALTTSSMSFAHSNGYKFLNTKVGSSWFYGLNLFEFDGHIVKNKIAFTTGLGMQFSNYHFEGNSYITPNIDTLGSTATGLALTTNKLYTYDLNVPLLIKFSPGTNKRENGGFHIAAGAIVRYTTTAKVVTETTARGAEEYWTIKDDFNMNPFRVDGTIRVGYDKIKLFANYSLTPYFNNSKAPDVRAFAAGIMLVGF
jgi:carbon monoxide dehydrogenase subunit G